MKKFYLICYCANSKDSHELVSFNEAIDIRPVYYLNSLIEQENNTSCRYRNHIITMIHEIDREEFNFYKANF